MKGESEILLYRVIGKPRSPCPSAEMCYVHIYSPNTSNLCCLSAMLLLPTFPWVCKLLELLNNCCISTPSWLVSVVTGIFPRTISLCYFLASVGQGQRFQTDSGYWLRRAPRAAFSFSPAAHKQKLQNSKRFPREWMQEYLTLLIASPAPVHNYIFNRYGLCRRALVCITSARTTELEETESLWNRWWRSRTVSVPRLHCFSHCCADAAGYWWWPCLPCSCLVLGKKRDKTCLNGAGRKDRMLWSDCSVLNRSNQRWKVIPRYRPGSNL